MLSELSHDFSGRTLRDRAHGNGRAAGIELDDLGSGSCSCGTGRGLDKATYRQLLGDEWLSRHLNVLLSGSTGVGKTYLACALGQRACRLDRRVPFVFVWQILRQREFWQKGPDGLPAVEGYWASPSEHALAFPSYALDATEGLEDTAVVLFIAGVVALLGVLTALTARSDDRSVEWPTAIRGYRTGALGVTFALLYFALPTHLHRPEYIWILAGRCAPVALFFLFLTPKVELTGARVLLLAPAIALIAWLPWHVGSAYEPFDREMKVMTAMLEPLPPDSSTLAVPLPPNGQEGIPHPFVYNGLPAWIQVLRGGYATGRFERPNPRFPYVIKRELPAPTWRNPDPLLPWRQSALYDYLLLHNGPNEAHLRPAWRRDWELVDQRGRWTLYRAWKGRLQRGHAPLGD